MNLITENRFHEITNKFDSIGPIAVVGDVGIDKYTYGEVNRISPEAPVPVLEVQKEWEILGLAANISHNLKVLKVENTLCGIIGDEVRATHFEHLLEELGLKTWGLVRDPSRPTIYKERITTSTQQICRIDYEGSDFISNEISSKLFNRIQEFSQDHKAIILEDYAKGTLTRSLTEQVIKLGQEKNVLVAVDPGRKTPPLFYKGADLLKPNLIEAKIMVQNLGYEYDDKTPEQMAVILMDKLNLKQVVITLGSGGMGLLDKNWADGKMKVIPTVAQEVFDVSGAGDTTISLLVSSLLAGANLEEAAWIGNCGAGVVVAKKGTATVSLEELTVFYRRLKERYQ